MADPLDLEDPIAKSLSILDFSGDYKPAPAQKKFVDKKTFLIFVSETISLNQNESHQHNRTFFT